MKNILLLFLILFCVTIGVYAVENIPDYALSDKLYTYENNQSNFQPLSDDEYNSLDKSQKKIYKNIIKADKYSIKATTYPEDSKNYLKFHLKALKFNNRHWVAHNNIGYHYFLKEQYANALTYINNVLDNTSPETFPIYNYNKYRQFLSYFRLCEYDNAIKTAKEFINTKGNNLEKLDAYYVIANSLLLTANEKTKNDNFNQAFLYANKYLTSKDSVYKHNAHEVRYNVFLHQKRKDLAKKEAQEMLKIQKSANVYFKLAYCSTSRDEKLNYYNSARTLTDNNKDYFYCVAQIAKLEQSKIDDIVKKLGLYVKKPDWFEVLKTSSYGSHEYWIARQDKFFISTNDCIKNYKGQNLVACFEQVNKDQIQLTQELNEEAYRQQQLAYQQELIRQQQIQNYYQSQNAYYARQNYYNNLRPKTYTVTPIGNSYYINQF